MPPSAQKYNVYPTNAFALLQTLLRILFRDIVWPPYTAPRFYYASTRLITIFALPTLSHYCKLFYESFFET